MQNYTFRIHEYYLYLYSILYALKNNTSPFSPAVAINVQPSLFSIAREALFGISVTASKDYNTSKHKYNTSYGSINIRTSKTGIVFLLFPSLISHTFMTLSLPTLHVQNNFINTV